jgi:hypothetical protein
MLIMKKIGKKRLLDCKTDKFYYVTMKLPEIKEKNGHYVYLMQKTVVL